jgi:hypothetical protein
MQPSPNPSLVLSYLSLRKAVGWLGLLLPFILALGDILIFHHYQVQSSISAYYYTGMGRVFIGLLCAIGVFHLATEGHTNIDKYAGRLACILAACVAWFPTEPASPTPSQHHVGMVHYISATLLFSTLAFFCLRLFTQPEPFLAAVPLQPEVIHLRKKRKRERNSIYIACGWAILASMALAGITSWHVIKDRIHWSHSLFTFESTALLAFGFAFLTRGQFLFPDPTPTPPQ